MQSFQYKLLNNVLFQTKKLHIFGIKSSPLCSFCILCNKTPLHILYECNCIKCLWSNLVQHFQNSLVLPTLTQPGNILEIQGSIQYWPGRTNFYEKGDPKISPDPPIQSLFYKFCINIKLCIIFVKGSSVRYSNTIQVHNMP